MSSGNFKRSKYQASYAAAIHPIRVQPETESAAKKGTPSITNFSVDTSITNSISAISSLNSRQLGLHPRFFYIQLVAGTPTGGGYKSGSRSKLVVLNTTFYSDIQKGDLLTYLGADWEVIGKVPEKVN